MITDPLGPDDAGEGIPAKATPAAPGGIDRLDYDEFNLDHTGSVAGTESSFAADDFPG
jgi:hypothetical protein